MLRALLLAATALILIGGQPICAAGAPDKPQSHAKSPPSKAGKHASPQARKPKVYGTPIQPPIVKKKAGKRTKPTAMDAEAKRKADAAAARKAKADLEYRRQNPASANGPR